MPPRAFVDTNVWFSAFWALETCERVIKAHIQGKIKIVVSQMVLVEIVRNLRKKIPRALPAFEKFFTAAQAEVVRDIKEIDSRLVSLVHRKDQKILASAIASDCLFFVTGNVKDFDVTAIKKAFKIKILTSSQAVELFEL